MSVVDIHQRITASERKHRDQQASDGSLLFFDGDRKQIEKFAIDFNVGEKWSDRYSETHNGMVAIGDQGIVLRPGQSVVIEVAERLIVPFNMYGVVVPTGSLFLDRGIIIAAAKIEPGFTGRLKLRLVNTGSGTQTVKRNMKVASGVFLAIEVTRHQDMVEKSVTLQPAPPTRRADLLRWLKENPTTWIGWLIQIIVSSVAAVLLTYLILSPPRQDPQPPPPQPVNSATTGTGTGTAPTTAAARKGP